MNTRRKLIVAIGASALTAPFGGLAQQPGKIWRVGVLSPRALPASLELDFLGAFPLRMRELGYVEGRNLVIEWRFADGNLERLPELAAELLRLKVDVILAEASRAIGAAQKATSTVPIVMGNTADPVRQGFIDSLARPGRNITGLSTVTYDLGPKLLELLLDLAPKVSRVAVWLDRNVPAQELALKNIQAVAPRVGVTILPVAIWTPKEIESAFPAMIKEKAQALVFTTTPLLFEHRHRIADLATKHRLPFVSSFREFVEAGALASYGLSLTNNYRLAATFVDKIFKGAKPADLPVEEPTILERYVNRKTAKALGLTIPQSLLISADKVID